MKNKFEDFGFPFLDETAKNDPHTYHLGPNWWPFSLQPNAVATTRPSEPFRISKLSGGGEKLKVNTPKCVYSSRSPLEQVS